MNNPDPISKPLETIFWVKIHKFFDADPGSGTRDGHTGSATGTETGHLLDQRQNIYSYVVDGCSSLTMAAAESAIIPIPVYRKISSFAVQGVFF